MALQPADRSRLIQAYGRHWRRDEVRWGTGWQWQMLGRVGKVRPGLRICDFSYARGVYVLDWNRTPTYVGIARGGEGFRTRLTSHHKDPTKKWNHFSWFSFDCVKDLRRNGEPVLDGWATLADRDKIQASGVNDRIGELEALMVGLLGKGLTNIQKPKFGAALEWSQIVGTDFGPRGVCRHVDPSWFTRDERERLHRGPGQSRLR